MLLAPAVVVWEWLNEHGRWRPYGPAVSHHIEAAIRNSDPRGGSVVLGQVDSRLSPYIIDLQSMHQFRQDTGTIRPVRRCFYEPGTAPAQGVQWEWESSTGAWTTYDMEASIAIHKAHSRQQAGLDLEPLGLAQLIDFSTMTQVNRQSGRCRRLRRRVDMAYPLVSGPLPRGAPRFGGGALLGVGVAGSNTLGRRTKRLPAPPPQAPPRSATLGHAPRQSFCVVLCCSIPMVPVKNIKPSSLIQPALAGITGTLMSAAGLPVCLTRPPEDHPLVPKNLLRPVPGFTSCCRKTSKKQTRKGRSPEEVVRRYVLKVKTPQDQDCPICMDPLAGPAGYVGPQTGSSARADTVVRLAECGHVQHLGCLLAHYDASCRDGSLQCAICKTVYGVRTGNQPAGKMQFHVIPPSLPGYPDCKTIRIVYNIPAGTQGPEDVNPGKPFTARGFPRHCYLPDTPKGRQVLGLLVVAWERRLVFTVGRSCTSGEEDTVVWNQVHHKTEFGSNLTGHGYPDPGHLDSMVDQLRALGQANDNGLMLKG
uniref:E3 ubiquitin-protein ligase n=1 Tax=Gadus morhua TaxID=8049 RepID=A0A8C5F5P0_GADMO